MAERNEKTGGLTDKQILAVQKKCLIFSAWSKGDRNFCNAECDLVGEIPICPPADSSNGAEDTRIPVSTVSPGSEPIYVFEASTAPLVIRVDRPQDIEVSSFDEIKC